MNAVSQRDRGTGFTLVELMVVIGVIGVLAVCVAPAMMQLTEVRRAAAARDVERIMTMTRTRAMGTGEPTGVTVDPDAGTMQVVAIAGSGRAPAAAPDASGSASPAWIVGALYPGVTITSFTNGDGSTASGTMWFAYDGTPQLRSSTGEIMSNFGQDASVVVGGYSVYIRKTSGLVERSP